jgi:hypothetical protein
VNPVPRWRIAAGILVLAAMGTIGVAFTPYYWHNFEFQRFVSNWTRRVHEPPRSEDELRGIVLQQAHSLGLPVAADDVHIARVSGRYRVDVRYQVPVTLPGYRVNLHFHAAE